MVAVDVHPHVIARDENRYPRAPLGGKQSDWSRERPVSADEMIAAMDEGLPICVQARAAGLPQLEAMLKRFPKARVALDHMARPAPDDAQGLFELKRYENLYLKLTAHNVHDLPAAFLQRVVKHFGA